MKLCLAIVVCLSAIGWNSVDAATCTLTYPSCVSTDFTSEGCNQTTKTCICNGDNVPIPTGCAKKLDPMVIKDTNYTNEIFPGSTLTMLNCSTPEIGATYQWSVNGAAISGATSMQYGVNMAGNYTCTITIGTDSATSPGFMLTAVAAPGPATAPEVTNIPTSAAPGATIDVRCSNIPLGAKYKFKVGLGTPTTTVTHSTSNMNISCVLDPQGTNFTQNMMSPTVPWNTTNAADITAAMISPAGTLNYKTGTPVIVTCSTTPPAQYMLSGTNMITYTFQDSANPNAAAVNNQYTVPGTAGNHTIMCSAKYTGMTAKNSTSTTVMFSDNYIQAPNLMSSNGGQPVANSSRLTLTCGDSQTAAGGVSYLWYKDGTAISRQRDRIIQYGSFQNSDAGKFYCTAVKGTYQVNSNDVTIVSGADGLRVLGFTALLILVALTCSRIF
jgi:hypothetical protein